MTESANEKVELRLGLPKGRMQAKVIELFNDAGIPVSIDEREYRPRIGNGKAVVFGSREMVYEAKLLKPQNIVEMLQAGSRDMGFAGADWVCELGADLIELLDTGLDPVKIVAAAPENVATAFASSSGDLTKMIAACKRSSLPSMKDLQRPGSIKTYLALDLYILMEQPRFSLRKMQTS